MATIKPVSVTSDERGIVVLDSAGRLWQLVKKTRLVADPEDNEGTNEREEYHEWVQIDLPEEIPA